jgi:hypothetical protein
MHYATSWKVAGSTPDEVGFSLLNPSSDTMALGSTQPLTEMSTRNLPGGGRDKGWPARKTDNLTTICEPIVSQPYGSSWPLTEMALHFFFLPCSQNPTIRAIHMPV